MSHPFVFAVRSSRVESGKELRERARRAEDLGYYAFHFPDHVLGPGEALERTGHPPAKVAIIPTIMTLADATDRLRVGARVVCLDYHNPVMLAKELATIDFYSDGRLELGLGAGWMQAEYEAMGVPFDPAGKRISRLAEGVALMKLLFSEGPVSFHGEHFHVEGFEGAPKPVQKPHPPITIGGGSQRVLQLAGRVADIVSLNYDNRSGVFGVESVQRATPEATLTKLQWIREGAGERFDELVIDIGIYFNVVTDNAIGVAEQLGSRVGLSAKEMMEVPHALIGSVESICDEIVRRREVYGTSYLTIGEDAAVAFAPVVERLAGR